MEKFIGKWRMSIISLLVQFIGDLLLCIIFVGFVTFLCHIITFFTTSLTLTNNKVTGKTGFINIKELDIPINKVCKIQIKQSFLGKIFNYGNISIGTASEKSLDVFNFRGISDPTGFKMLLNKQIEEYNTEK